MVCGFILSMSASSIHFARWRWNRARSLKGAFNCQSVAMAARDSNSAALLKHSGTVVMGIGLAFPGYTINGRQGDGWAAPITSAGASRLSGHVACRVLDFGVFTVTRGEPGANVRQSHRADGAARADSGYCGGHHAGRHIKSEH